MEISGRNQLTGMVTVVTLGAVMAEVTVDIGGGLTVVATITRDSVERLGVTEGSEVVAVVKATEVMIGKRVG